MKIVSNPKKIQRYYKIGMYTSLASLVFLFGAVGLTLSFKPELANYSFLAMLVGLILSQIGVYFANRWGKSPRVDERISQSLKGLDDRYTLYHYVTSVPHLLAGPTGFWVIEGMYQGGTITYENGRYRQQGVRFFSKFIGQESIGQPDAEARSRVNDFVKELKKSMAEEELPPVEPVVVFTNPKTTVQAPDAPVPTMHIEKFKDFIRRATKEQPNAQARVQQVQELLPDEDII